MGQAAAALAAPVRGPEWVTFGLALGSFLLALAVYMAVRA